jgi:hypothetical protein
MRTKGEERLFRLLGLSRPVHLRATFGRYHKISKFFTGFFKASLTGGLESLYSVCMETRVKQADPANMTIMPHNAAAAFGKRFRLRGNTAQATAESDDRVDFQVIYRKAGLPTAPFTAEETLAMLSSLSPELPPHTRKHTVLVTLGAMGKAIGATPETICADGSRKVEALNVKIDKTNAETLEFSTNTEREIATLQAQIAEKQAAIETAKQRQKLIVDACKSEGSRLTELLEFFGYKERSQ